MNKHIWGKSRVGHGAFQCIKCHCTEREAVFGGIADCPVPTPNPGSEGAQALRCTCPVIDNHHGAGTNGRFLINGDCPVHGWQE